MNEAFEHPGGMTLETDEPVEAIRFLQRCRGRDMDVVVVAERACGEISKAFIGRPVPAGSLLDAVAEHLGEEVTAENLFDGIVMGSRTVHDPCHPVARVAITRLFSTR